MKKYDITRIAGIYAIINRINGKYYIGSASYVKERFCVHRYFLRQNKHDNDYLQKAWNKYGEENFKFIILEIVEDKNILEQVEQFWIDVSKCYKREKGYNLRIIANNNMGIVSKLKGKKLSEETKRKIGLANFGRKQSAETIMKKSIRQKGNIPKAATLKAAIINRNLEKWPCETGYKCRCKQCMKTRNDYINAWRKSKIGIALR